MASILRSVFVTEKYYFFFFPLLFMFYFFKKNFYSLFSYNFSLIHTQSFTTQLPFHKSWVVLCRSVSQNSIFFTVSHSQSHMQIETPKHAEPRLDLFYEASTWTACLPRLTVKKKRACHPQTARYLAWAGSEAREKLTEKIMILREIALDVSVMKKTVKPRERSLGSPRTSPLFLKRASKNTTPSTP